MITAEDQDVLDVAERLETETAKLFCETNWGNTSLGPSEAWSPTLKTQALTVLSAKVPILMAWGPDMLQIYNDQYIGLLGKKHPHAFARSVNETWPEIRDFLNFQIQRILKGESFAAESLLLPLKKSEWVEEGFFTFSYSPVFSAPGKIEGLLAIAFDETQHVISRRRDTVIDELLKLTSNDDSAGFWSGFEQALAANDVDFSRFALLEVGKGDPLAESIVAARGLQGGQLQKLLSYVPSVTAAGKCVRMSVAHGLLGARASQAHIYLVPIQQSEKITKLLIVVPHDLVRQDASLLDYYERVRETAQSGISAVRHRRKLVKHLKEELEETGIKYRLLFEGTDDGVLYTSIGAVPYASETILAANDAVANLLGYEREKMVGITHSDVQFEDDIEFQKARRIRHETGSFRGDLAFRKSDGNKIELDVTSNMIFDESGRRRAITILRDVSQRKLLEQRTREAAKMDVLGQLTGGIAHDFNNLLTVILGGADELCDSEDVPEEVTYYAKLVRSAAERGTGLTQHLLSYARRQTLRPKNVDLNELLRDFEPVLRSSLRENIALELSLDDSLREVKVDVDQFLTAMLNLAVNSRDAMPRGGRAVLTTKNVELPMPLDLPHARLEAGDYVSVAFSDTGMGIPADKLSKVFEPFFTTKAVGDGTGLGLSMVQGFVTQSGGDIAIDSAEGQGTVVTALFPAAEGLHPR